MSINPLELQTLFSQLNRVGKQQALTKENEVLKQEILNSDIHKQGIKDSEEIPETKDLNEEFSKIKDEEKSKEQNKKEKNEKQPDGENEESQDENQSKNVLTDPKIGRKIDILG
ncbi:MAG TPA: hypothetical protein PK385_10930 [Spirochaetota bacterium]|nr:hypothetical protein [Spirochaetota bacterium]HOS33554.1 hypothetical protein [Spirochaetota bacterium]HOS56560.1 hypothetical protein [Spirochaetota bacterium]HPK62129.1 hypothetical protein [Spirochaetota bacterium]HQF78865.1 hypothetical protein [Spirochaetota bacterium]